MGLDFATRKEVFFICYHDIIKTAVPFILEKVRDEWKDDYKEYIDMSRIENKSREQLVMLSLNRIYDNVFEYLKIKDFDTEGTLNDIYNYYPELFKESDLLKIGRSLLMIMKEKFVEKIYIYTPTYDKRIHEDIQDTYGNMDLINYVVGDLEEVLKTITAPTCFMVNDCMMVDKLIELKKVQYTTILVPFCGFNTKLNLENKLPELKLDDIEDKALKNIFKFSMFMSEDLSNEYI